MSTTTTANARVTRHLLADYDLYHSQPSDGEAAPAPAANANPPLSDLPPNDRIDWEDRWRRVPPYRPTQNQVDEQRNTYANEAEHTFIRVMFTGVVLMSSLSYYWRATGGKFNSEYFRYKVGGEW